ncbi:MAG: M23 family metallopeptidase [Actinobacteria bacterium]|nr:M23 family metallopeptidase [Actinomycetota bacterium]
MTRRYARAVLVGVAVGALASFVWAQVGGDDGGANSSAGAGSREAAPGSSTTRSERSGTTGGPSTTTRLTTTTTSAIGAYAFPIEAADAASYGRSHHDYPATDIFAPCGSGYLAPTAGVIHELSRTDRWVPSNDTGATRGGLFVSIVGDDGVRYYASHLQAVADGLEVGDRVTAGERLGAVGESGNARGTGCHVHFGLSPPCEPGEWSVRRGAVYPWPYLDSWLGGGGRSPSSEVEAWGAQNPNACATAERADT